MNIKKLKTRLLKERDELVHLAEMTEEDRKPVELDQSAVGRLSRMDALQSQAMALETERRREIELHRIDAALQRISAGEFGFCNSCGEEIEIKRLELDPTAPVCIECAE